MFIIRLFTKKHLPAIYFALLCGLLVGFLASGCTGSALQETELWSYSDLRALEGIDSGSSDTELIALFLRSTGDEIQIRMDLLEVAIDSSADYYLLIDDEPGGSNYSPDKNFSLPDNYFWDVLVSILSNGSMAIYDDLGNEIKSTGLEVHRDTFLDTVYISFSQGVIKHVSYYNILTIATSHPSNENYDLLGPFRSDSPPPPGISVSLVFWDTFSSATPALALRSWDGAHEGPNSSRHGLRYLIEAAGEYHVPIRLVSFDRDRLDVALGYLGVKSWLQVVEDMGLVVLSDCDIGDYGYAQNQLIYDPSTATSNGLSENSLRDILSLVGSPYPNAIIGGSLQNSSWGSVDSTKPSIEYIAKHPWIQLVDMSNIKKTECIKHDQDPDYQFLQRFNAISPNRIRELALDTYNLLLNEQDHALNQIRSIYLQQVGHILAGAAWVNSPTPLSDCSTDIDWDGEVECVLATQHIFTTYELSGGYLAFAFVLIDGQPHQIIGPSYQLSIGLSDSSLWNANNGLYSDPAQIIGSLADLQDQMKWYEFRIEDDGLIMTSADMAMRKSFTITESSLLMHIISSGQVSNFRIPFIIDPWIQYQPMWVEQYSIDQIDNYRQLTAADEITMYIFSNEDLTVSSFLIPWEATHHPEDPNYDYTSGYFLPFPLTVLETKSPSQLSVLININPKSP